jgi:hypothetical protein
MAIEVTIKHLIPPEIMSIVHQLRDMGCEQGIDFDFAYTPEKFETFGTDNYHRFTTFTFYNEKYATWFNLKYSDYLK